MADARRRGIALRGIVLRAPEGLGRKAPRAHVPSWVDPPSADEFDAILFDVSGYYLTTWRLERFMPRLLMAVPSRAASAFAAADVLAVESKFRRFDYAGESVDGALVYREAGSS